MGTSRLKGNDDLALDNGDFVAIRALTAAVDDQKLRDLVERQQGVMPGAGAVVDSLVAVAAESAYAFAAQFLAGRRYHHQERGPRQRDEGLARQRMTLHQKQAKRQAHRLGPA